MLAHLILTHGSPDHLKRLVGKLANEQAHFYIHVDKKTSTESYLSIAEQPNVFFIKKRVKVLWGGYSIVQATVNAFEEILASGVDYSYINLLSGKDYPIKDTAYIHRFFSENPGKIFMRFLSVKDEWHEAIQRFTKYHLVNYDFPGKYRLEQIINRVLPARKLPTDITLVGRSQWFTISKESVIYIVKYLKAHPAFVEYFKLSWAPDESIFQTILYNSPLKKDMVNDNLLYVDWSMGGASPKELTMDDKELLRDSNQLFARKFNSQINTEILDYLDTLTY